MFAQNKGTNVLPITNSNFPKKGEDGVLASAVCDKDRGEIIVKVANTCDQPKTAKILLNGLKQIAQTTAIALDCSNYDGENTVDNPHLIEPKESAVSAKGNVIETTIPAKTFIVYKVKP